MEYFYTLPKHISNTTLAIEGEEFSHLTHVMRKQRGDAIRVVDGVGNAYDVSISEINKRTAMCEITAHHRMLHEPNVSVTLAIGVLKNSSNYDFLIEKCTELGVNTFVPMLTERTIPQHAKTERWQKLALAAMKQCGRCVLPKVSEPQKFKNIVLADARMKVIPHEKVESPTLSEFVKEKQLSSVLICIGPEGGFSDEEIELAMRNHFQAVSLGVRRLRTETAAIAAVSLLGI